MSKYCTSCGSEIFDTNAQSCPHCGNSIINAQADSVQTVEQNQYQYNNQTQSQTAYNQNQYSQNTYGQYSQTQYTQPNYYYPNNAYNTMQNTPKKATSVGGWVGWTLLCSFLPIIGQIIMMCTADDESAKNWAKANLLVYVIVLVLTILLFIIFAAAGISMIEMYS